MLTPPKSQPVFLRLIAYVKPYSVLVVLTVLCALTVASVDISLGQLIKGMIEQVGQDNTTTLVNTAYLIAGLMTLAIGAKYTVKYATTRFSACALRDLRNKLILHMEKLPVQSMEKQHSGDVVSRLTNDITVMQNFFTNHFSNMFYMPVVFIGALTILLMTTWKLILVSLAVLPVAMVVVVVLSKPIGRISEQLQENFGKANAIVQDAVGGIQMVKAFNMKHNMFARYTYAMADLLSKSLELEKRRAMMSPVSILLLSSPIIVAVAYGGYMVQNGELDSATIILFMYLLGFVLEPLGIMPVIFTQIQEVSGAAKRVFDLLDQPIEEETQTKASVSEAALPVSFEQVTFDYNGQAKVLTDLSFTLEKNKSIALVGSSGSGKSTILKLLCGFYPIGEGAGSIKLFGKDLREWNVADMRSHISLVSQDTYLFPVSIAENISYGRLGATRDDIIAAAQAANAHDFIIGLDEGYETVLGERGSRLSGGQRQRIAIARAILKDSPILLLDEPTSALDTESEALVQTALEKIMQNRTVLVIAHRLSTIKEVDEVLVLNKGQIAERGTHEQLINNNGLYTKLYLKQFASQEQVREEGA